MVWWWTQDELDLKWLPDSPWRDFLALPLDSGERAVFAEEQLEKGLTALADKVIPTPLRVLGRISPIFSPFFPVFCAFSPPGRGGSNEPQAETQG